MSSSSPIARTRPLPSPWPAGARHWLQLRGMGASRRRSAFSALRNPHSSGARHRLRARWHRLVCRAWASPWQTGAARAPGPCPRLWQCLFFGVVATGARTRRIPRLERSHHHLELTMIHEVMVLDHGGPDLASYSTPARSSCFSSPACWCTWSSVPPPEVRWAPSCSCRSRRSGRGGGHRRISKRSHPPVRVPQFLVGPRSSRPWDWLCCSIEARHDRIRGFSLARGARARFSMSSTRPSGGCVRASALQGAALALLPV